MTESEKQVRHLEAHHGSEIYGIYWGVPEVDQPLVEILEDWLMPRVGHETVAVEIGSGGGRWTRFFQPAKLLYSIDATAKSEELIRKVCDCKRFRFLLSPDGNLPAIPAAIVDYVFSFDTFVHFEPELFDAYVGEIARVLKPGGILHLHYAARVGETIGKEFRYREPAEVQEALRGVGIEAGRELALTRGYGSMLVEGVRV